jgi:hypothetical protein
MVKTRWLLLLLALAALGWFVFQLLGPRPAIHVSPQTTFVTEPLDENGLPDLEQYWLEQGRAGVRPENNAAVLIWRATWPGDLAPEHRQALGHALGITPLPSADEALESPYSDQVRAAIAGWLSRQGHASSAEPIASPESGNAATQSDGARNPDAQASVGQPGISAGGPAVAPEHVEQIITEAIGRPWTSERIPPLAEWVARNQEPLDLLLTASRRPHYYSPSPSLLDDVDESLINVLLPGIQKMRDLVRALKVRAMWHLGEGRVGPAWQDLLACHSMAQLTAKGNTLVEHLVAIAIRQMANQGTLVLLSHDDLSPDEARQVKADLEQLPALPPMATAIDRGERLFFIDTILRWATGRPMGVGQNLGGPVPHVLLLITMDWNRILRQGNHWYDRIAAALDQPTRQERQAAIAAINADMAQLQSQATPTRLLSGLLSRRRRSDALSGVLLGTLLPAVDAAASAEDRAATQLELVRTAAALAAHRVEQDGYPETLGELVPRFLAAVPIDPYTDQPLIYVRRGSGYLVYSRFENGADDGGTDVGGDIVQGEWLDERPGGRVDRAKTDLVVRIPVPEFRMPGPWDAATRRH